MVRGFTTHVIGAEIKNKQSYTSNPFAAVVCLTLSPCLSEENRCFCKAVSTQIRRLISPQYEGKKCGRVYISCFHMPSRRLLEHKNLHSSSGVARLRKCMNLQFKILSLQSLTLYVVYILTLKFSRQKRDVRICRHLSVNLFHRLSYTYILEILYIYIYIYILLSFPKKC